MPQDESIELLLQQDVLWIDVRVDERETRAVGGVFESSTNDLKHGSDARAPRDQANFARKSWAIFELALWSLDTDSVADLEEGDDTGYITLLVRL
jgi:hypothetical protein